MPIYYSPPGLFPGGVVFFAIELLRQHCPKAGVTFAGALPRRGQGTFPCQILDLLQMGHGQAGTQRRAPRQLWAGFFLTFGEERGCGAPARAMCRQREPCTLVSYAHAN